VIYDYKLLLSSLLLLVVVVRDAVYIKGRKERGKDY
jgi:hypothetical protein